MIDDKKDRLGVEPICRVLEFSPSTYYARKTRTTSTRARRDERSRCCWSGSPTARSWPTATSSLRVPQVVTASTDPIQLSGDRHLVNQGDPAIARRRSAASTMTATVDGPNAAERDLQSRTAYLDYHRWCEDPRQGPVRPEQHQELEYSSSTGNRNWIGCV
jgi:hypothetical protein